MSMCNVECAFCPENQVGGIEGLKKLKAEVVESGESRTIDVPVTDPATGNELLVYLAISSSKTINKVGCSIWKRKTGIIELS